jgi:hypothetical protein
LKKKHNTFVSKAELCEAITKINENQKDYYISYKKYKNKKYYWIYPPNDVYKFYLQSLYQLINRVFKDSSTCSYGWTSISNPTYECVKNLCGSNYLLELDLSRFFDQIDEKKINDSLTIGIIYHKILAGMIPEDSISKKQLIDFITVPYKDTRLLARGFPTSPVIANLIRKPLDQSLNVFAYGHNLTYAVYGDNMLFSGDSLDYPMRNEILQIIKSKGFEVNPKKLKIKPYFQAQKALGFLLNNKEPRIPKKYVETQIINPLLNKEELTQSLLGKIFYVSKYDPSRMSFIKKTLSKNYNYDIQTIQKPMSIL